MCQVKHSTPGARVSMNAPATGVARVRWDKDIPANQTLPLCVTPWVSRLHPAATEPGPLVAQLALRCSALDHCATRELLFYLDASSG